MIQPTPASPAAAPQRLDQILAYPYRRLEGLIGQSESNLTPLLMHIGEPKFGAPPLVADVVAEQAALWSRYPAIDSEPELRAALSDWFSQRFGLADCPLDPKAEIHPVCGSKEGLFQTAAAAVLRKEAQLAPGERPVVLVPNPLYHPYFGAALLLNAEVHCLDLLPEQDFKPDFSALPEALLRRTAIAFVCSPGNPTGGLLDAADLRAALALARQWDFILASDECYSEVWYERPPVGLLQVAGADRRNAVVLNSLSKRSAAPGLRAGVIAGDPAFMDVLYMVRGYVGAQVPGPLAQAAARLWADEQHVEGYRDSYRQLRGIADSLLGDLPGYRQPQGGFFIWLDVARKGGGARVARALWQRRAVKVLPGEIMARPFNNAPMPLLAGGSGGQRPATPGDAYLRLPLVYQPELTREAFERVRETYEELPDVAS